VSCRDSSLLKLPCCEVREGAGQDLFLSLSSCILMETRGSARGNEAESSTDLLACRSCWYLGGRLSKELGGMNEEKLESLGKKVVGRRFGLKNTVLLWKRDFDTLHFW